VSEYQIHSQGDVINARYTVQSFAGEGGMQEVYLAHDLHLQKQVALKVPKNRSAQKRFQRSAVVSAKVNHPNVAKTLDYIEVSDAQYLVEEFVAGTDIKQGLLDRLEAVEPALVAKAMHHTAKGLDASHRAGVIHRDLKPSNVMFTGGPGIREIKITDFGIAKMAGDEIAEAVEGGEASISASKTVVGALPYMAPEMITDPRNADRPSDVWAVGAMTYELLTGEPPFGVGLPAVPGILQAEPPLPPAGFASKTQFKTLADEIHQILIACLSKDPAARPSANQLAIRCEALCYSVDKRFAGVCSAIRPPGNTGFISQDGGGIVFFHRQSVYGPMPSVGDRVSFSSFPGYPYPRAHPIVLIKQTAKG
jgi:serine/threonine-protein kinase